MYARLMKTRARAKSKKSHGIRGVNKQALGYRAIYRVVEQANETGKYEPSRGFAKTFVSFSPIEAEARGKLSPSATTPSHMCTYSSVDVCVRVKNFSSPEDVARVA